MTFAATVTDAGRETLRADARERLDDAAARVAFVRDLCDMGKPPHALARIVVFAIEDLRSIAETLASVVRTFDILDAHSRREHAKRGKS